MLDNTELLKEDHRQWFYTAQHLMDFVEFLEDHVENLEELHELFKNKLNQKEHDIHPVK